MKTPKYECIGGPMDGKSVPKMTVTVPCQSFTCQEMVGGVTRLHFYRLCVCHAKVKGQKKQARFWHYIGTTPDLSRRPSLRPPRRMYK